MLLCLAKCPDKPLTFREIGIYTWGSYREEDKKISYGECVETAEKDCGLYGTEGSDRNRLV